MKIRMTCKLPSEILGVGYALAGIIAVGALILGIQFTIVNYGATVMKFLDTNAIILGFISLFFFWAFPSWHLEDEMKSLSHGDRLAVMVAGTIVALVVAAILAYTDNLHATVGTINIPLMGFLFVFQLVAMLVGWLGHWCKRCIRIEPDAGEVAL